MPEKLPNLTMGEEVSLKKASVEKVEGDFPGDRSDREIWTLFKNGHAGAFRYIYLSNYEHLHRFGHRITFNDDLIKDCIQDLFIELNNSRKLSDIDSIRFYLLKALKIKLEKALKKQKQLIYYTDHAFEHFRIEMSEEVKLVNVQIEEDNKKQISYLLNKLTKKQREALYYFYFENLSYKKVAEIMGFSHVRSARNLIYKALDSVRIYMKMITWLLATFSISFL